jgi:thiol-disulfide isomerase/thioredoxin
VTAPTSPESSGVLHRVRRPLWFAAGVGIVLAIVIVLISGRGVSSPQTDVILDEPGEYQQPGISTNAPLLGTNLRHGEILDLDGAPMSSADWFGPDARPMLINFWFTACPPCRREMPALQQAYETYGSDVRFIGVNVQDSSSAIRSFTDELDVTYEMVRDPNGTFVVPNGIAAFPTTLFVDSSGRIVKQVAGELTTESIDTAIAQLLSSSIQ